MVEAALRGARMTAAAFVNRNHVSETARHHTSVETVGRCVLRELSREPRGGCSRSATTAHRLAIRAAPDRASAPAATKAPARFYPL